MNLTLEQKRFYTLRIEFILDPKDSGVLVYFDVRSFCVLTTVERGTLSPFLFAFFLFFRGWGWIFPWIMVQESNNELRLILIFVFKELVFWPFTKRVPHKSVALSSCDKTARNGKKNQARRGFETKTSALWYRDSDLTNRLSCKIFYYLSASGSGLRSAIMGCTQANSVAMTPSIEWAPPDCMRKKKKQYFNFFSPRVYKWDYKI